MRDYAYPGVLPETGGRAVALGMFDGVHIGHRAVVTAALTTALRRDLTAAVCVFDALPHKGARLCGDAERRARLDAMGVAELITLRFAQVRDLTPEAFVHTVLRDALDARVVCVGFNYRFGRAGGGDAALLTRLCGDAGIEVVQVPALDADGGAVSASRIRALLEAGDVPAASRLLGYPYCLRGAVARGRQLGRTLGMPTANLPLPEEGGVLPRWGVYAAAAVTGGTTYRGVLNIGRRPTVGGGAPLAEMWLDGFSGDLYGEELAVYPLRFLRAERTFDSLAALGAQMAADRTDALADTGARAVLFDFDDTLQDRGRAFEDFCDWFLARHFPGLDAGEVARRKEQMITSNNNGYVYYLEYYGALAALWEWDADIDALAAEYQAWFPLFTRLYPDAAPVLAALRARGYRVGVITNGPAMQQHRKLDVGGVRPLLDVALVAGEEGVSKPEGEIFRRAAALLGTAASRCVYVGDHPRNDVAGALGAGLCAVYMNACGRDALDWERLGKYVRGTPAVLPVPEIKTLAALLPLPEVRHGR